MQTDKIINNTEKFVKDMLGTEGTGHDWWHIVRVRNNARQIHKAEGGDWFVVDLALMLHDVGDRKVIKQEVDDHSIAERFLKDQGVSADIISQVMFIIKNMSYSKNLMNKNSDVSLEFRIVQDADRLDATGAIGIARAFTYGGVVGQSIYDPTKTAQTIDKPEEYKKITGSTFHHFEEKLFRIKDLLNTETAKKIAEQRNAFMQQYIDQFLDEWNGAR